MRKKRERPNQRKNFLSDELLNSKNLLSNDNQLHAIPEDRQSINLNFYLEGQRRLKRCRQSGKQDNRTTCSRKCRRVSRGKNAKTRDDSSSSSNSSSDIRSPSRREKRNTLAGLTDYTFYSVINTGVAMDQGTSASALCRSFLALYLKLDENSVYSNYLDTWDKAGQKITVLKGYNHKHLQYLAKEVRHIALESNTLYRTTGQARVMLVLTAFGREEDMEEAFDDLCYLH